jgi:hypothetical protein
LVYIIFFLEMSKKCWPRFRVRNSTYLAKKKTRTAKILVFVNQSLQRQTLLSVSKSMRKNGLTEIQKQTAIVQTGYENWIYFSRFAQKMELQEKMKWNCWQHCFSFTYYSGQKISSTLFLSFHKNCV